MLIVKYGKVTIPCKYKAKDLWLWDEEASNSCIFGRTELQDAHAVNPDVKEVLRIPLQMCLFPRLQQKVADSLRLCI